MKPNPQPVNAIAKLDEATQGQSPKIGNGDSVANLLDKHLNPPLLIRWMDSSEGVRMSKHSRYILPYENTENPNGPWRVDGVASERPQADTMKDATVMLAAIEAGDSKAAEQLLVLVYDELRRLAASKLAQEAPGQTLQPTALVHEAWLRLVGGQTPSFNDREHFFRASAEAMRRILIDRARRKHAQRHGGGYQRVDFEGFDFATPAADDQVLAVNDALDKLAVEHPVQADLVKLRYFAGLTNEEVSQVLGISLSTAKNYWTFSRAWLLNEIEGK
jgi:RNA polymerase sigma factor (TIGR02999 family)